MRFDAHNDSYRQSGLKLGKLKFLNFFNVDKTLK